MQIADRTFVISGGSSGLGAATARRLAAAGAQVVLVDLNDAAGRTIAQDLGSAALYVHGDVTDETSVRAALDAGVSRFGLLHGAISCAGIGGAEKTLGKRGVHGLASFRRMVEVNLVGSFNLARLTAERLAAQVQPSDQARGVEPARGVIVLTASIAAEDGQAGQVAYAASKGGVASMVLPMARDLAPLGIRVVAIAPGLFDTPLLAGLPAAARTSLAQQVPYPPRLGRPDEFAALALHVLENEMLNGAVIRLDGGLRMAAQ